MSLVSFTALSCWMIVRASHDDTRHPDILFSIKVEEGDRILLSSGYRLDEYRGILRVSQSESPRAPCGEISIRHISDDDLDEELAPTRFDVSLWLATGAFGILYGAVSNGCLPSEITLDVPAIDYDSGPAAVTLLKTWNIEKGTTAPVNEATLIVPWVTRLNG